MKIGASGARGKGKKQSTAGCQEVKVKVEQRQNR